MLATVAINSAWLMAGAFGLLAAYLAGRMFPGLARRLWAIGWRAAVGCAAMAGWDAVSSHLGLAVGINPVTALTVGVLGLPGFLLLVGLRVLLFHG